MRSNLAIAFAAGLVLLVAALVTLSILATNAFVDTSAQVATAEHTVQAGATLADSLDDAEDANRGYLLTSADEYQQAFERDAARVTDAYAALRASAGSDPERGARLDVIKPLIDERLQSLRHGMALMARDPALARRFVSSGVGQAQMDRLRRELQQLQSAEQARLAEYNARAHRTALLDVGFDWAGGALGIATILIALGLLQSESHNRARAEQAVRTAAANLESQVAERTSALAAANAQLQENARELAGVNRELDAFTASVSHDLRAPLRVIEGLARLIDKRIGSSIGDGEREDLRLLMRNVRRMRELIEDLLAFSRMSRSLPQVAVVDSRSLVEECWQALATERGERTVAFSVGELPAIQGDPQLLRQVFSNLLSNAVKYSRGRPDARIEVSARRDGAQARFQISDNGVGFDPSQSLRLFNIFSRLHGDEEFEGTGVGLAIVRRVVERHGGQVWAEGMPGHGATFGFSVPAALAPSTAPAHGPATSAGQGPSAEDQAKSIAVPPVEAAAPASAVPARGTRVSGPLRT